MYLHGWMNHCCGKSSHKVYELVAQARQFSSFLLVIGTMMGHNQLNPQEAIILQNKDEVIIPLLLNELPSVKEFRDAIQSLSPEQQQFAKAYRSMQLESSVFGVCVIQIKPQLEALLGLSEDSLAKEIKLTEDLMDLFIEYQIPSDLLSYDGNISTGTNARDKVENVREHVEAVLDVIDALKEKQLENSVTKAGMSITTTVEKDYLIGSVPVQSKCSESPFRTSFSAAPKVSSAAFRSKSAANTFRGLGAPAPLKSKVTKGYFLRACSVPQSAVDHTPQETGSSIRSPSRKSENNMKLNTSKVVHYENDECATSVVPSLNFASLPKALEGSIEKYDKDSALRSTTIKAKKQWSRKRQKNLLAKYVKASLHSSDIKSEKNKAFALLDALSRSGSLPIIYSDLHVVVCVTHRFEKDMMDVIIQDNINPIERLELSTLLLGSTVHGTATLEELVAVEKDKERLRSSFPQLLESKVV